MFLKDFCTTDKMFRQRRNSTHCSLLVFMIFLVAVGQQVVSSTSSSSFKDVSLLFSSIQSIPSSIEGASVVIQERLHRLIRESHSLTLREIQEKLRQDQRLNQVSRSQEITSVVSTLFSRLESHLISKEEDISIPSFEFVNEFFDQLFALLVPPLLSLNEEEVTEEDKTCLQKAQHDLKPFGPRLAIDVQSRLETAAEVSRSLVYSLSSLSRVTQNLLVIEEEHDFGNKLKKRHHHLHGQHHNHHQDLKQCLGEDNNNNNPSSCSSSCESRVTSCLRGRSLVVTSGLWTRVWSSLLRISLDEGKEEDIFDIESTLKNVLPSLIGSGFNHLMSTDSLTLTKRVKVLCGIIIKRTALPSSGHHLVRTSSSSFPLRSKRRRRRESEAENNSFKETVKKTLNSLNNFTSSSLFSWIPKEFCQKHHHSKHLQGHECNETNHEEIIHPVIASSLRTRRQLLMSLKRLNDSSLVLRDSVERLSRVDETLKHLFDLLPVPSKRESPLKGSESRVKITSFLSADDHFDDDDDDDDDEEEGSGGESFEEGDFWPNKQNPDEEEDDDDAEYSEEEEGSGDSFGSTEDDVDNHINLLPSDNVISRSSSSSTKLSCQLHSLLIVVVLFALHSSS